MAEGVGEGSNPKTANGTDEETPNNDTATTSGSIPLNSVFDELSKCEEVLQALEKETTRKTDRRARRFEP